MDLKQIIQSKPYAIIALLLAAVAILVLTFAAGMYVGSYKARFSYQWAENYHRNFAGPRGGLINPNGVAGEIIKIDSSSFIVKGQDNMEKIVLVQGDTLIERFRETIKLSDLKVDNSVVVIGEPNGQGQINAKFIRVLPFPTTSTIPVPMRGLR